MPYAHRPTTSGEMLGLKLRYLRCLEIVGQKANGTPVVDLVEIEFGDDVWIGFSPDRHRVFIATERDSVPLDYRDGKLIAGPGVTVTRKRVQTPAHMKGKP